MNRAEDNDPPSPIPKQGSDISDGNNRMFDESFNGNNSCLQEAQISTESERLDVMVMKRTLEQANVTIRRLHGELQKDKLEDYCEPAPVVEIPGATSLDEQQPLVDENHRTVNVRMLDGENFVTEWDDLRPPLPPPPDHGLRSPIVRAVLEQWTSDRALHDSLVSWIERVMTGDDLETVPPLTISSLDHQVRDGFTMHVLPLLLRRADIHVAVQTRAHRRTAYDMAVIVNQKSHAQHAPGDQKHSLLDQHVATDEWVQNFEPRIDSAMSVANSAVTEQITNGGTRPSHFRKQEGNDEEYTFFGSLQSASADVDDALHHQQQHQHQSTIMGALGGALGGLLSRNKFAVASPSRMQHFPPPGSNLTPEFRAQMDLTASPIPYSYSHDPHHRGGEHEEQPYHRVVSAPPGRIGVTFVEYRGHAMVSDVAPDSPLSSWVFPSDILIAIDEVPVSGMRVRDIIQVMTTRRDRQRALRVISSHAMNEFTLNANNLNDEAE